MGGHPRTRKGEILVNRHLRVFVWLLAAPTAGGALAQGTADRYPVRPVRMIVPAPPGGSTDTLARIMSGKLAEALGQSFVVDNRGGAGGTLAAETVARAQPDGHTLSIVYTALTVNAVLQKVGYDPVRDFAPISLISTSPLVLTVGAASTVRTVKDLIALARAKPLSYGSAGVGSGGHVCGTMLNLMAGIDAVHVPYKGAGPAAADVAGGQIHYQFAAQLTSQGLVKAGKLRMVAVTSARRAPSLPDVPTMAESGLPGFDFTNWFGLLGPAALPAPIVARLNAETQKALASPDVRDRILFDGGEPAGGPASQFRDLLASDVAKWGKIARAMQMKPQ